MKIIRLVRECIKYRKRARSVREDSYIARRNTPRAGRTRLTVVTARVEVRLRKRSATQFAVFTLVPRNDRRGCK